MSEKSNITPEMKSHIGVASTPVESNMEANISEHRRFVHAIMDEDPIYHDEEFAKTEGLPGAIVPGIMSMAYLARLLNTAWPDGTITQLDVVFRQLVLHNQIINLVGVVTDTVSEEDQNYIECDVYVENSEGSRLVGGKARLDIPSKS